VVREYDGDYLTTPGIASTDWKWRPHQKRVIARIIQSGNTYMAHAVGAGKTSAYDRRRHGNAPARAGAQADVCGAEPHARAVHQGVLRAVPDARDRGGRRAAFHTDRRKQFIANVALDDLDAVIITHSAFGMIPVSDEFPGRHHQREIDDQYRDAAGR
jgi:N12 class adenine-specific DNA methylase